MVKAPEPTIEDERFEWEGMYVSCWKWTCPTCQHYDFAPLHEQAELMFVRHDYAEHRRICDVS